MTTEKGFKSWQERYDAKRQRWSIRLKGLRDCRVAAGFTQKELADLVGSNQATIADLEIWDKAGSDMLERLCRALKVAPEDLVSPYSVEENVGLEEEQERQAEIGCAEERAERRRQVNRIKRRGHYGNAPGTVLLRGLKDRRVAAGLTQRELAKRIRTNQTTIFELEKRYASRGAYMSTIRKLCEVLKVSPADLICRD